MAFTAIEFTQYGFGEPDYSGSCYIEPATVQWLMSRVFDSPPQPCVVIMCVKDGIRQDFTVTETMHQVVQLLSGV